MKLGYCSGLSKSDPRQDSPNSPDLILGLNIIPHISDCHSSFKLRWQERSLNFTNSEKDKV